MQALIFEIGVQIEKNGKAFYLEAAKRAVDEASKALFTELAEWENAHIALFQQLKADLSDMAGEDHLFDLEVEPAPRFIMASGGANAGIHEPRQRFPVWDKTTG